MARATQSSQLKVWLDCWAWTSGAANTSSSPTLIFVILIARVHCAFFTHFTAFPSLLHASRHCQQQLGALGRAQESGNGGLKFFVLSLDGFVVKFQLV